MLRIVPLAAVVWLKGPATSSVTAGGDAVDAPDLRKNRRDE